MNQLHFPEIFLQEKERPKDEQFLKSRDLGMDHTFKILTGCKAQAYSSLPS